MTCEEKIWELRQIIEEQLTLSLIPHLTLPTTPYV